jgi:hypothetical protein
MEEKSFDHLNKLAKGPGGVNWIEDVPMVDGYVFVTSMKKKE